MSVNQRLILSIDFPDVVSRVVGWSAFAAVAIVFVVYILNYPLAKYDVYVSVPSHAYTTEGD